MRLQDWAFLGAGAGLVTAAVIWARGNGTWALAVASIAIVLGFTTTLWARRNPSPMPHFFRFVLALTRLGTPHLQGLLQPKAGERFLEVGPGTGHNAITLARALLPEGEIEVLDVQQEMLDAVMERARRAGSANVFAKHGDARHLPFPDESFDAAYLSAVLGEIPDRAMALRELHRVLKPASRLVIAEILIDPDFISSRRLRYEVTQAGFLFERSIGAWFAYAVRFRRMVKPTE